MIAMPNRLNLPDDLEKLVEKREEDRRKKNAKSETVSGSRRTPSTPDRRRTKGRRKEDRG
jgi:hypothetical protein